MFEKLLGNENVKKNLTYAIENQNILHSYLFIGIEGIGKKLFARDFAKKILCLEKVVTEDNCKSCLEFENNNNPDYIEVEPEDGKTIKIDQIRYIEQKILEKPIISDRKVYIINNCETMTKEAQNCLLKTLEEPPEFVTIILITNNESKILSTIKSRCMKVPFIPISEQEIRENMEEDISESMLQACNGSIGKLLKIKDKKQTYEQIEKLIEDMKSKDLLDIIKQAEIIYKEKEDIQDILEYINQILLNKKSIQYIELVSCIENAKRKILASSNYDMTIDELIMKMWENIHNKV